MKICFVTSLFGDSYQIGDKPGVFDKNENYDYYLFTNYEPMNFNTSWDVINIKDLNKSIESNIIKSRYPKFMCWKLLEDVIKKHYDVVVYCDCYLTPNIQVDWDNIGQQILGHPSGLLHQIHVRDAYQELDVIVKARKDSEIRKNKTLDFFRKNEFPERQIMSENCVFGYNPNNEKLRRAFSYFWEKYSKYDTSHRDQPLWSFTLWKYDIKPLLTKSTLLRNTVVRFTGKYGFKGHTYV